MIILELLRLYESDHGTLGVLKIDKVPFCVTLEPSDLLNRANVSSIPVQQYDVYRTVSPKYGDCFQVHNVPGRSNILFHPGNRAGDTEGCILLAEHFGKLDGDLAILNSGKTYQRFMAAMEGETVLHLTIREVY